MFSSTSSRRTAKILRHVADAAFTAHSAWKRRTRAPSPPFARTQQPAQHPDQRGLPRPFGPGSEDLAADVRSRDPPHEIAEAFDQLDDAPRGYLRLHAFLRRISAMKTSSQRRVDRPQRAPANPALVQCAFPPRRASERGSMYTCNSAPAGSAPRMNGFRAACRAARRSAPLDGE